MTNTKKTEHHKLHNLPVMLVKPKKIFCATKFKKIISSFKQKNTIQKFTDQTQPHKLDHQSVAAALSYEPTAKLVDTINANMGALAQAASWPADEINRLIKKMALSFSAQKNESSFYIKDGIFNGTQFTLKIKQKNLYLYINQANSRAKALLNQEKNSLATKLKKHEINLDSIRFLS